MTDFIKTENSSQTEFHQTEYTLFFRNVVFPAQNEYSYFSAYFRLKKFRIICKKISYDISALEYIGLSIIVSAIFFVLLASFAV